jgi:branched-chain amino acid transport system substrate-binding protein
MRPVQTSCLDHMGSAWARVHTWDGKKWNFSSDWYQGDEKVLRPMVISTAQVCRREENRAPHRGRLQEVSCT